MTKAAMFEARRACLAVFRDKVGRGVGACVVVFFPVFGVGAGETLLFEGALGVGFGVGFFFEATVGFGVGFFEATVGLCVG